MSDSAYCVNTINDWIYKWSNNNWKKSNNQPVENLDLIQSLYKYLIKDFWNCQVIKTKAHCGNIPNEIADALATGNDEKFKKYKDKLKQLNISNIKERCDYYGMYLSNYK